MSEAQDAQNSTDAVEVHEGAETQIDDAKSAPEDRATAGPFDATEVPAMRPYVDMGGIKVAPREGLQLRLEVDDRSKRVVAVSLDYQGSLLQVQAFSAPKSTGLWHGVRHDIQQQMLSQGAQVEEVDGTFGPELAVTTPAPADQGGGSRVARFIAVDGPRWMLRGVIMGRAATQDDARAGVDDLFREIVVVRGDQPMPPSKLLALRVPAGVQQQGSDAQASGATQA